MLSQNCEKRLLASSCLSVRPSAWNNPACSINFPERREILCEKILYSRTGLRWQYGARPLPTGLLRLQTHTKICNTYCFSTSTAVTLMRLSVTSSVHCLSSYFLILLFYPVSFILFLKALSYFSISGSLHAFLLSPFVISLINYLCLLSSHSFTPHPHCLFSSPCSVCRVCSSLINVSQLATLVSYTLIAT